MVKTTKMSSKFKHKHSKASSTQNKDSVTDQSSKVVYLNTQADADIADKAPRPCNRKVSDFPA